MFQKNDRISLQITDLSRQGEGIGKVDDFVFFVKDTVPGDVIEAQVTKCKKTYGYAHMRTLLSPSPDRVDAPCAVARTCGGCSLQALSYAKQLQWKEQMVKNCLERIGGFSTLPEMQPIVADEKPLRYRHKAIIPIGYDQSRALVAGFYAAHSHRIIPCTDCLLAPAEFGVLLQEVLAWMKEEELPAYEEESGQGLLRHLLIRKSRANGDLHLCLVAQSKKIPAIDRLVLRLQEHAAAVGPVTGISWNVQPAPNNVLLGKETILLHGKSTITEVLTSRQGAFRISYRISPTSFFQVHPAMAEEIADQVLAWAALTGVETVFDLYCGIGTLALFLAQRAKEVIGVEVAPSAVKDARKNAALNGIKNARFLEGRAEEIVPELLRKEKLSADIVVVDPPRKGCAPELLQTIAELQPKKILYVSCDPASLARDLKMLSAYGFLLEKIRPYDQFAMTCHVEVAALLRWDGTAKVLCPPSF